MMEDLGVSFEIEYVGNHEMGYKGWLVDHPKVYATGNTIEEMKDNLNSVVVAAVISYIKR